MSEKNKNVFSSLNPKTTFFLGLIVSVLVVSTVGFFVLLAGAMDGDKPDAKKQQIQMLTHRLLKHLHQLLEQKLMLK